ncbi:hypothetical protein CK203_000283 [Vitis vinifera]|uniref:SWIB domain-containing protein n=1 Tax=Vitis vinifera TaxID=29760 RepID=A0A438KQU9_VITVI|nr:hypothetical protein CK203_000283 [Vitis vinifera]
MVSDSELVARLHEFLRSSDLNTTTTAISQLEKAEEDEGDGGEEEEEEHKSNVKSEGSNGSDSKDENDDDDDEEEEVEESSNGKGPKNEGWSKKSNKEVKKRGGGFANYVACLQNFKNSLECPNWPGLRIIYAGNGVEGLRSHARVPFPTSSLAIYPLLLLSAYSHILPPPEAEFWIASTTSAPVKPTPKEKQRKQEREDFLTFLCLFLKDPSDKRRIICDEKLKELFDVDSFNGFTVPKLLSAHFIKTEQ